jgi:hypothetical protein
MKEINLVTDYDEEYEEELHWIIDKKTRNSALKY